MTAESGAIVTVPPQAPAQEGYLGVVVDEATRQRVDATMDRIKNRGIFEGWLTDKGAQVDAGWRVPAPWGLPGQWDVGGGATYTWNRKWSAGGRLRIQW